MKNLYGFEGVVDERMGKLLDMKNADEDQLCETLGAMLNIVSEDELLNMSLEDCFWKAVSYLMDHEINRELLRKKIKDMTENDWEELFGSDDNAVDFKVFKQQ